MTFWSRLRHHLFDRPISQKELGILSRLFDVALAETDTESEFELLMRQMVQRDTGLGTEHAWRFVLMHLEQYRRPLEDAAMPRTLARRFLQDPPVALSEKTGFEKPEAGSTDLSA